MSFRQNLNLCLKALEQGRHIKLKSGHKLEWSEEHQAPGFHAVRTGDGKETDMIFQIDSDVAWMSLISYAREMTEKESTILAANIALTTMARTR
jgi:hypothetical protein